MLVFDLNLAFPQVWTNRVWNRNDQFALANTCIFKIGLATAPRNNVYDHELIEFHFGTFRMNRVFQIEKGGKVTIQIFSSDIMVNSILNIIGRLLESPKPINSILLIAALWYLTDSSYHLLFWTLTCTCRATITLVLGVAVVRQSFGLNNLPSCFRYCLYAIRAL